MGVWMSVDSVTPDLTRVRNLFVNLYCLGTADSWVLVDAGLKGSASGIIRAAEQHFGKGAKPKAVILTHGHFDHVGAFPALFETWDVPVYAHALEAPFLTGQSPYPPPDPTVGKGMMALLSFTYPNKPIDLGGRLRLLPGDGSVPFAPSWRWIHTPGHTPGHVSLFRDSDRCLIAGDAFVTTKQESVAMVATQKEGVFGPPSYFTPDWNAAHASVSRLAKLDPEIAATGHGKPLRGPELRSGLQRLNTGFDDIALPRQGRYVPKDHRTRSMEGA
ncbi:MAG: MBL fold metallo-hydrolase [Pseudomonadota bacterium]